jgi:hypothetical protein
MIRQQLDLDAFYRQNAMNGAPQRYRDATVAELYYLGKQYEDKRSWWDRSVPLRDRKPLIIVPLFKDAIESLARFTWGGHRFPALLVPASQEDGSSVGPLLNKDDAHTLTKFANNVVRAGRLARAAREFTRKALITTSAAIILGARGGYLTTHVETGKHCTPEFDPNQPGRVKRLTILYQYPKEEQLSLTSSRTRMYWYRRVVDENADTTFKEIPVQSGATPDSWEADPERTVEHGLGWCPAHWVRTLPDDADPIDGRPVIDPQLYPMLDDINYVVSQRSRAVRYGCDPKKLAAGIAQNEKDQLEKQGAGETWFTQSPDAKVSFIETIGYGVQRATEHLNDLTTVFREAVSVVKADPKTTSGNISGVVLEFLHAPMISLASDLRADLGDDGYCMLVAMAMRLAHDLRAQDKDLWIEGIDQAVPILDRSQQRKGAWLDAPLTIQWPAFFPETEQDKAARVQYTNQALQGELVGRTTATRQVAPIFDIEDVEAEQDAINDDRQEAMKREGASLMLPPRSGKQPPPDGGGGGGGGGVVLLGTDGKPTRGKQAPSEPDDQ